jgi:hypothetical protein
MWCKSRSWFFGSSRGLELKILGVYIWSMFDVFVAEQVLTSLS